MIGSCVVWKSASSSSCNCGHSVATYVYMAMLAHDVGQAIHDRFWKEILGRVRGICRVRDEHPLVTTLRSVEQQALYQRTRTPGNPLTE